MRKMLFLSIIYAALSSTTIGNVQGEGLSKEVEDVLDKRIKLVTKELAQDPLILKAVKKSNERNKNLSLEEKIKLDKKWRAVDGIDEFIKGFITNECAERLIDFQDEYDGFSEIFVADANGLNTCQTNKTTDFYQADEDWWVKGYNEGKGRTFHGEIEYDESAMLEAIPIFIPIIDPDTQDACGVMKVIIDIIAIKMEF